MGRCAWLVPAHAGANQTSSEGAAPGSLPCPDSPTLPRSSRVFAVNTAGTCGITPVQVHIELAGTSPSVGGTFHRCSYARTRMTMATSNVTEIVRLGCASK